jgi:hypothetical protein
MMTNGAVSIEGLLITAKAAVADLDDRGAGARPTPAGMAV